MQPKTWIYFTVALAIFALILLVAGVFSPLWIYLSCEGVTVAVGLVYRTEEGCDLDTDDNCGNAPLSFAAVKYNSPSTQDRDHWGALAGLEIGGTAMGIVLVFTFVVYASYFQSKRDLSCFNLVLMAASIMTWMPVGAGLIVFALYHGDAFTNGPDISTESFPWSAMLCFIAGVIMVFVTILIRTRCRKDNYVTHAVPASVDSKTGLYPSSQSGFGNRYFAPNAFREDRFQGLNSVVDQENKVGNQLNDQPRAVPLAPSSPYNGPRERREVVVSKSPLTGYQNRGYETEQASPYDVVQTDQRRVTTEVVLGRRGAAQDVDYDNEGKEVVIYKGRDNMKRIEDGGREGNVERRSFRSPAIAEDRLPRQPEFLLSAHHLADSEIQKGSRYMAHTTRPGNDSPSNGRMVLSQNNFTDSNVKYNPTYAYRPYSEQVY